MSKFNIRITLAALLAIVILITTLAAFINWAPASAGVAYWVAMLDISTLELLAFGYLSVSMVQASRRTGPGRFPFAMHASIAWTMMLFLFGSAIIDVYLLHHSTLGYSSERLFIWVVIIKWVALFVITAVLGITGSEGIEQEIKIASYQPQRLALNKTVNRVSSELRRLQVNSGDKALLNEVTDKAEILRNKTRSLQYARVSENDDNAAIQKLSLELDAFSEKIAKFSPENMAIEMNQVKESINEMIRLLG